MVYEIFVGDTKLGQFSKLSSLLQLRYVLNDLHASDWKAGLIPLIFIVMGKRRPWYEHTGISVNLWYYLFDFG